MTIASLAHVPCTHLRTRIIDSAPPFAYAVYMKKIEWNNRLNMGVPQIDEQHRRLLHLTNNLAAAIQEEVAQDILEFIIKELQDYTSFHFRDEELLMKDIGYPELENHTRAHNKLKTSVDDYRQQMEQGNEVAPQELLDFLGRWLIDHIIYTDKKIAEFIKENEER